MLPVTPAAGKTTEVEETSQRFDAAKHQLCTGWAPFLLPMRHDLTGAFIQALRKCHIMITELMSTKLQGG